MGLGDPEPVQHGADIVAGAVLRIALGILQHLLGFPRDLLDAACIDGASSWRTLWGIVVPNLRAPLAALAILLAAVGLYGTLSYHVQQRTREIGVRVAIGAMKSHIIRLVLGQGSRWVGIGLAAVVLTFVWRFGASS